MSTYLLSVPSVVIRDLVTQASRELGLARRPTPAGNVRPFYEATGLTLSLLRTYHGILCRGRSEDGALRDDDEVTGWVSELIEPLRAVAAPAPSPDPAAHCESPPEAEASADGEDPTQGLLVDLRRGVLEALLARLVQALRRWLDLCALLLAGSFFFEFPNNQRHLCTTMPWSIWPSLAVLWGVCWMFYAENAPYRHGDDDEGYYQAEVSDPRLLPLAGPPPPLDPESDGPLLDWDGLLDHSSVPDPHAAFDLWTQGPPTLSGSAYSSSEQGFEGSWDLEMSPAWDVDAKAALGSLGALDQDMFFSAEGTDGPLLVASSTPTSLGSSMAVPLEFAAAAAAAAQMTREGSSGLSSSTGVVTPPYTSPSAPSGRGDPVGGGESAPLRCDQPGCETRVFQSVNEMKKHSARHARRFNCGACGKKFGTRNDLQRHRATVHSQGTPDLWYCDDATCRRRGRGFSRKDNFMKHMRDVHGRVGTDAPTRSPPAGPPAGAKRRRVEEDAAAAVAAAAAAGTGAGAGGCECHALRREMKELRGEVEALRREREVEAQRRRDADAQRTREAMEGIEREASLLRMLERVMSENKLRGSP